MGFFLFINENGQHCQQKCAYLSFQTLKIFVKTNVHKYIQIVFATLSLNLNGWLILLPKANVQSGFIVFNNHFVIITCIYINTCISSGVIGWFILLHIILHLTASCSKEINTIIISKLKKKTYLGYKPSKIQQVQF